MQSLKDTVTKQPDSALTAEQWETLEEKVFENSGEALTTMHTWALAKAQPPIATVIMAALWSLSSLPAGTTFNAGMGAGSINTLVALVGKPGQGKDLLIGDIAQELHVSRNGMKVELEEAGIGTGEGIITRCEPDKNDAPADPVLFGVSEISSMETLMKRQGAILRPTIMSMYSGNALGVTNKSESTYVPRNSYTAGLWVGVQPDKAGALLAGPDDGLAHRFIWTELVDPHHTEIKAVPKLHAVVIPDDMDKGFTYPNGVKEQTRKARVETLKYGAPGDHKGHRHQTRLKLAAGLALLRSSRTVSADDWERSGALMDYSDLVRRGCLAHLEDQSVRDEADRMERRERADDQIHRNRVNRNRKRILEALADDSREDPVPWYPLLRARPGRERESMTEALQQLVNEGVVAPNFNDQDQTESLSQGPKFNEGCHRDSVANSLKAVS